MEGKRAEDNPELSLARSAASGSKEAQEPLLPDNPDNNASSISNKTTFSSSLSSGGNESNEKHTGNATHTSSPSVSSTEQLRNPRSRCDTPSKSNINTHSETASRCSEAPPHNEQSEHQLQQWAYETRNSIMPFSEKVQKRNWENQEQQP